MKPTLLALLAVSLVGCQDERARSTVQTVFLEDGTRCAIVYFDGITCDWSGPKRAEKQP